MKIKIEKRVKSKKGILMVPVFQEDLKKLPNDYPKMVSGFIMQRIKNKDFDGKQYGTVSTYLNEKTLPAYLTVMSIGKKSSYKPMKAREIGGKIGKYIKKEEPKEATIIIPNEMSDFMQEFVEGFLMSQYSFEKNKTKKKKSPYELKELNLVTTKKGLDDSIKKAELIREAIDYTKDLVNCPANSVDAEYLAKEAKYIAKKNRYKIAIFGDKDLKKMGWGGLLAVNQGSKKEAKAIVFEYDGGKRKEPPIAIVGKGIIFDTGGYNLKPTNHIETMHQDMAGAAVVFGLFSILKKMDIKKNVVGVVPIAENLISEKAYRPSDIIKMFSGKTVEVTNTDAEGRLVLADGMTYASKLKPKNIITIATLTGAVSVALGDRYAGLVGNDSDLRKNLQKAGKDVDDLGWSLPLHRDFKKKMDSEIADIRNSDEGTARLAGTQKGAAFLERFTEKHKWCHIDIGGTAFIKDPKEYEQKGATASGLRMLLRYLEK